MLAGVDSLTQATLGAAVGELVLGRRLGNRALAWGGAFGTLPDLDVLISPLLDHAGNLWWHRGPSHSLLVMTLASFLLAPWLARRWGREKVSRARAGAFVFLVWSTHVLIDCFTVYGTSVLWPFSDHRAGFNHLFIIDPLFTLPLLVAVIWSACLRNRKSMAKRRRVNAWGLGLATAYALLSIAAKQVASQAFEADLARRGLQATRRMEAPTPFNIILWRSVADCGDVFRVGYRSLFDKRDTPISWTVYPKGAEALAPYAGLREASMVRWFSDDWWIARPHATGAWIGDLRFGELRSWHSHKDVVDHRFVFAWNLVPDGPGERLRQAGGDRGGADRMLARLARRALGDRAAWESTPRLAGITGHLPEILSIESD
jgi:inner membrane protein